MPSLLSKYRNKKRESSADEARSNHRKGASDSSHDSGMQSPPTVGSARGLNSPFMGEEKRASPPKTQRQGSGQQFLHETPPVSTRSPKTPTNSGFQGRSGQPVQQGFQNQGVVTPQGQQAPRGYPASQGSHEPTRSQGTPQQTPQAPQGPHAPQGTAQGTPQGQKTRQPRSQGSQGTPTISTQSNEPYVSQRDVPSTPSHAMPVQGERIERLSPKQDRHDPWAEWQIRRACPSARFGHSANNVAARDGELLIMGGIRDMDILDDLWIIDTNSLSGYQVKTEGPYVGPRVGHAALTLGNAYIMIGGDTKIKESDPLDDNLYLLNTSTFKWTVAEPAGPRPCGRYGHSICNIGVRIYVFGGQVDDLFFDDMWVFDLNNLRPPNARWDKIEPATPPPPPRTNHTVVTYDDKIYLFGGANGDLWYSDTWCFDPATTKWTQLECTGYVPAPCQGHAATIVGDVMYVFGGMSSQGLLIGQLFALKLTTCKWYTFQNLGAGPSPRSGHSLTAFDNDKIIVWGGTDQSNTGFVLDVSRISYPPDNEAVVDSSLESNETMHETISQSPTCDTTGAAGATAGSFAGAAIADPTNRQVDTHERSTPAARNSVIYSRTSWSPHRRSRMSQHYDDHADIPKDVKEVGNEDLQHDNSYSYDQSEDFNKSLEHSRLNRDRPDMENTFINHGEGRGTNRSIPELLPSKVPDTPPTKDHATDVSTPSSGSGIAGAVSGAAGAIGAIGAGIFGKQALDKPNHPNDSTRSVTDDMPGAWSQTRVELDSDSSEPQIPGINTDAKSVSSAASSGSANHTSQHTLDRLNEYENTYEDALQNSSYAKNVSSSDLGIGGPTKAIREETDNALASASLYEQQQQLGVPDKVEKLSISGKGPKDRGLNPPYSVSDANLQNSNDSFPSDVRPFEVQTSTGGFQSSISPQDASGATIGVHDYAKATKVGTALAGVAATGCVVGVATSKLNGDDLKDSYATSEGTDRTAIPQLSADKQSSPRGANGSAEQIDAEESSYLPPTVTSTSSPGTSRVSSFTSQSRGVASSSSGPSGPSAAGVVSGPGNGLVDKSALKKLEAEFAQVREDMQKQSQEANQRIKQLEQERDEALSKVKTTGAVSGVAGGAAGAATGVLADRSLNDYKQKHAVAQRDLVSIQDDHKSLLHEHSKLQAQHADLSAASEHLTNTMDQHVRALDAVNRAFEQSRAAEQNALLEADELRAENTDLRQKLAELQKEVEANSHHAQRSADLETQLGSVREAHESTNVALNQHLTQLVGHWDQYHQSYQSSKSTDRVIPSDAEHYNSLYEQQRSAHQSTQEELDAAYQEIAQLKEAHQTQPNIDQIRGQHKQELESLQQEHESKLNKLFGDHDANVRELHTQYKGQNESLEKQYGDLEREYNDSLEHFKSQRVALERTREELNRMKEANNKLEEELQDTKLQLQDPDTSTASSASNRHAEVMVRGLKAKIMVLEEERDELRQKVSKLKEAALASNF